MADDFEFEPMDRGRRRPLLIAGAIVALGVVAYGIHARLQSARRAEALTRAATAWNQLRHCLLGTTSTGERPSHRLRRIEIGTWQHARALESVPPAHRWPRRCSVPATELTHALFEADVDDDAHELLAMLASRAATALEQGALRTGESERLRYIDELFEAARRARLPDGSAPTGPGPPDPVRPVALRDLDPLVSGPGAADLVAVDPVAQDTLRLVLGRTERNVCVFEHIGESGRTRGGARCDPVPAIASVPSSVDLLGADDDAPAAIRVRQPGASTGEVRIVGRSGNVAAQHVIGGYVNGDGRTTTVQQPATAGSRAWQIVRGATSTTLTLPAGFAPAAGPLVLGRYLLFAGRRESGPGVGADDAGAPDAGGLDAAAPDAAASDAGLSDAGGPVLYLFAGTIAAEGAPRAALRNLGTVTDPGAEVHFTACGAGQSFAIAIRGSGDQVALTFANGTGFSRPVEISAPRAVLTCSGSDAVLTWKETSPRRLVHQAHCSPLGCRPRAGPLPVYEGGEPLVTGLGPNVLVVASPGPGRGVRMRLAPAETLDQTDDVVLLDDGDHGGVTIQPLAHLHTRGDAAVVVVTDAAPPHRSYAVRIDRSGSFRAVRRRQ